MSRANKKSNQYTWSYAVKDYGTLTTEERNEVQKHMSRCSSKEERARKSWFIDSVDVVLCDKRARERQKAA